MPIPHQFIFSSSYISPKTDRNTVHTGLRVSMSVEDQAMDPVNTGLELSLGLEDQAMDPVDTGLQLTMSLEDA